MQVKLLNMVPTTGGIGLAADVYLPDGPGPFPTLVTRTPYHRKGAAGGAAYFTGRGYAKVVQDCRGKYDSEGVFRPLVHEAEDGRALIDWVADQRWCNGRIGLQGGSYLGIVQVPAASGRHEALRCISPNAAPASFFHQWIRYGGCFALANAIRWAVTHASCRTTPAETYRWEDLWALPSLDAVFERVGHDVPELREWVAHDRYDDYWKAVDQHRMYPDIAVPGMHMSGWFDHLTFGTFDNYAGVRDRGATDAARAGQRLLIGPWGHTTQGKTEYGLWEFGPGAAADLRAHEMRFFDLHLKDVDDGISEEPPVRVFLMGANRWVEFSDWPPPGGERQAWYLDSSGEAVGAGSAGRLSREGPHGSSSDSFRYDPAEPAPTVGGPHYWGMPEECFGPRDQRPLLERGDVLYYRSERLGEPLAVVGDPVARLWIASDCPDTDIVAKLCVVEPSGRVVALTVGSLRCRFRNGWAKPKPLDKNEPAEVRIPLAQTAFVFPAGSRLALIVTSSSFPRILPNPNTMEPTFSTAPAQTATNSVLHDDAHPSALELPVLSG